MLVGWTLYAALIFTLTLTISDFTTTIVRNSAIILPQIAIFYFNFLYLAPNYLENNKKRTYFITVSIILIGGAFVGGELDMVLREYFPFHENVQHPKTMAMVYIPRFFMGLMPIVISSLILKSILLAEKNKESLELKNKMLAAETKALKAQINPHFLFNTLNNIYSLSQLNKEKTGDAILQLSDILRYVTYEGNQKKVPLSSEIETIESFIKLQLLKDNDASNVEINIDISKEAMEISPLLLIPFVENCFKHSNHHDKVNGWIKISIKTENKNLVMVTSNSTPTAETPKDKTGGVGMENVKKRLSLLYPDKHNLVIRMDKTSYSSTLEIDLS